MIEFDGQGHVRWNPKLFYELVESQRRKLIDDFLLCGTPEAFATRTAFHDFLEAVAKLTGVHPRNLFLRGSCHVGFSVAPKPKVWTSMHEESDLDLAIVDPDYFSRINQEVRRWADENPDQRFQGEGSISYVEWQQDRRLYNCCRADHLPLSVFVPHQDAMFEVAEMMHCGRRRALQAFVFRDWWSVRRRYEYDLLQLCSGVRGKWLTPPGEVPLPAEKIRRKVEAPSQGATTAPSSSEGSATATRAITEAQTDPEPPQQPSVPDRQSPE